MHSASCEARGTELPCPFQAHYPPRPPCLQPRRSLDSVLEVVEYNIAHQNKDLRLFEVSDVTTSKQRYQELCIVLNGNNNIRSSMEKVPFTYFDIKGVFESMMQILGLDFKRYKFERLTDSMYFHPGRSAKIIVNGKMVGVMGEIHPNYSKGIGTTYVLDVNLSSLLSLRTSNKKMQQISKFPTVERDYAFVIKNDILVDQVINVVRKESHGIISSINVFDIYEGDALPSGYKSVALKVTFTSLSATLTDKEINPVEEKFIASLNKSFGAYLRN